jgi:hypothetical protein
MNMLQYFQENQRGLRMNNKFPKKIIINNEMVHNLSIKFGVPEKNISDIPIDTYIKAIGLKTFQNSVLEALFTTNHFIYDEGKIKIKSKTDIKHIAGHVFENYIVNTIRYDFEIGMNLLNWATGYSPLNFSNNNFGYDDFFSFYFGLKTVAKASNDTKHWDTNKYSHTSKHDVEFFVRNPNSTERSICLGGFQIKAINGNEKNEIIIPLLKNEYTCVLTMLENPENGHSYDRCLKKIKQMLTQGEITFNEAEAITKKIGHPGMFGISQQIINYIYFRLFYLERKGASIIGKNGKINPHYYHIYEGLLSFAFESEEKTPFIISSGNSPFSIRKNNGSTFKHSNTNKNKF